MVSGRSSGVPARSARSDRSPALSDLATSCAASKWTVEDAVPTIEEADQVADRFEELLRRYNVEIANGSRLADALLFARHVMHVREGTGEIVEADDRPRWREMIGVFDLARRLLTAEASAPDAFRALTPWLRLFGSTRGQLAQNAPAQPGDQDADRVFELLVALCLLPHLGALAPDRGYGDNPDLLFQFRGETWGIACKRLYSASAARFRDTVRTAITQIEKSRAQRGLVFVSLVNRIDHDAFYPMRDGMYVGMSREAMIDLLDREQARLEAETVALTDTDLTGEFAGKKAMPGIVHYLGTTYMTGSEDAPVLKVVQRAWTRGRVDTGLIDAFQHGLNSTSSTQA
jgi:hypothetical protein